MGPLVLYLAGPYRGDTEKNIQNARKEAKLLWEAGYFVITPHLNTQHFEKDCDAPEEVYLEGYIEIMKRCDGVALITEDYSHSAGTVEEVKIANENSLPVHSVLWWLKKMEHYHLDQYDV
jgi:nucleoside 2-deoxyribosyltransferase